MANYKVRIPVQSTPQDGNRAWRNDALVFVVSAADESKAVETIADLVYRLAGVPHGFVIEATP